METPFEEAPEENQEEAVEIYSKQAILWFSILFNPIFGGALLMQNLRDVGYKKEATRVMVFSVLYYLVVMTAFALIKINAPVYFLLVLSANVLGGYFQAYHLFPRYFPENDYYPKGIFRVALRCIMIVLLLMLLTNYLQTQFPALMK